MARGSLILKTATVLFPKKALLKATFNEKTAAATNKKPDTMARIITLILASGSGQRMGTALPKQFLELNSLPVLMHTIQNYANAIEALPKEMGITNQIVVVLPPNHIERWSELCQKHNFNVPHLTIAGGATRFESVQCGLKYIAQTINPTPCLIAVHDGVRPFIDSKTMEQVIKKALTHGSAIASTPVTDSIRQLQPTGESIPLERENIRAIQTPQVFQYHIITQSYIQSYSPLFSDDSTVCQAAGHKIQLVSTNPNNIKITTPQDLAFAQYLLWQKR